MTRSRYGMLAGMAGAAFAAWWWRRRGAAHEREREEVIFSNTPMATP